MTDDDLPTEPPRDDWPIALVAIAAWKHLEFAPGHTGALFMNGDRATCCAPECGWRISGRLEHAGEERSAVFAMIALAAIGVACTAATWEQPT